MTHSMQSTIASVFLATAVGLFWFRAPMAPTVTGAVLAGLALIWRNRRVLSRQAAQVVSDRAARNP